jgi:predicted amidophosphoribosyltransferase
MLTNCPNCGAPVALEEKSCPYCETPYTRKATAICDAYQFSIDAAVLVNAVKKSILTPNEARRLMGLYEI